MVERDEDSARALAAMLPGAVADAVLEVIRGAEVSTSKSPQIGELVKAVCRAKLRFGAVVKDREALIPGKEGKGGYKYGYATLAAAAEATDQPLAEEELTIFYNPDRGPGWFAVTTELYHSSDQFRSCTIRFDLPKEVLGPQGTGILLTYGRRYGKLCILDLAPTAEDDSDAGSVQGMFDRDRAQSGEPAMTVEALTALAKADPLAAFAAVRKAVAAAANKGNITENRLKRLYAIAGNERGWKRPQVDAACANLLGCAAAAIQWPAYDLACALFEHVGPQAIDPSPGHAEAPPAQQQQPVQTQVAPPPPPAEETLPEWPEVWAKIRHDWEELSPEAKADPIGAKTAPAVMEGFARSGWSAEQVTAVLGVELGIGPAFLPKDGTAPPVFRKVAKLFKLFKPADVPLGDVARYAEHGFVLSAPPASVGDILASIPAAPATADEAWQGIRAAVESIAQLHPEATVPLSPDDRLTMYGSKARNGNRSSGDVAALIQHYLGMPGDKLPSVVFDPVLRTLAAFPVRQPEREEVLGRLPEDPKKMDLKKLGEVLQGLLTAGVLTEEEVPRSGAGNKITKEDVVNVIERVRDRALMEAGHA